MHKNVIFIFFVYWFFSYNDKDFKEKYTTPYTYYINLINYTYINLINYTYINLY